MHRWIAAMLVAMAVAAPAANAARPDDRAGIRGPGAAASQRQMLRPDDRAGIRGVGALNTAAVHADSRSFGWRDAAIGGAFAVVIALGTGALLLTLRRRGSPRPA